VLKIDYSKYIGQIENELSVIEDSIQIVQIIRSKNLKYSGSIDYIL